jgi:hypothetical protein
MRRESLRQDSNESDSYTKEPHVRRAQFIVLAAVLLLGGLVVPAWADRGVESKLGDTYAFDLERAILSPEPAVWQELGFVPAGDYHVQLTVRLLWTEPVEPTPIIVTAGFDLDANNPSWDSGIGARLQQSYRTTDVGAPRPEHNYDIVEQSIVAVPPGGLNLKLMRIGGVSLPGSWAPAPDSAILLLRGRLILQRVNAQSYTPS